MTTEAAVRQALRRVVDPELGVNIVDLGLVYRVELSDGRVRVVYTMTTAACPLGRYFRDQIMSAIRSRVPEAASGLDVDLVWDPPWTPDLMSADAKRQLGVVRQGHVGSPDEADHRIPRRLARLPLLAIAMLSMACGMWLGLLRIGWPLPLPWPDQLVSHGPLMIGGFLGTLIGLERAVAVDRRWAYAAPILTAAGAVLLDVGRPNPAGGWLITLGSLAGVFAAGFVCYRQPALFTVTMLLGAGMWTAGNLLWIAGHPIFRVVFLWLAFLVLTIAAERLELNRVLRPSPAVRLAFVASIAALLVGAAMSWQWPAAGVRTLGAALLALAAWLFQHDVARRTVRQSGLTRFVAVCLLLGYGWLAVGGAIALATGVSSTGPVNDAVLHAVFLGFVMSMVFGHAPIIFPAVLGVALPWRVSFYGHVGLLHLSVAIRLAGDLSDTLGRARAWGGLLNAAALALFVVNTAWAIASSRGKAAAQNRSRNSTNARWAPPLA